MEHDEAPTEGARRVASLFATSLLAGLVALWGLLEASEYRGPTERVIDAVRAARSSLRAKLEER